MAPRPRNPANKSLPQNLYFDARRSTNRYRRPTDGKWFQFGTERIKALDAAKQSNLEFMRGADLVGAVMSASSESFTTLLDKYEADVLPPRELAKGTRRLYAVHFRRFRKQFAEKAVDQISIRMVDRHPGHVSECMTKTISVTTKKWSGRMRFQLNISEITG